LAGGNEIPANELALLDRLYINDGTGHFTKSANPMSVVFENKSCVSVADMTMMVIGSICGNLASPAKYGCLQHLIYINDSKVILQKQEIILYPCIY
jgi:hypothetical protein